MAEVTSTTFYAEYMAKIQQVRDDLETIMNTNCDENCFYDAEAAQEHLNQAQVLLSLVITSPKDN